MTDIFFKFFQNPIFLLVMVAVLIPIIIEWLLRRRRRRIKFSAMRFLFDTERPKKIRMQDRILLILRTLIIFLIVLAIARPLIRPENIITVSRRDMNIIFLFDATYSNAQRVGNVTAFERGQRMANELMAGYPDGAQVILGVIGHKVKVAQEWTADKGLLRERIESMKVSHGSGSIRDGLEWALQKITEKTGESKQVKTEVFIFSDMQAITWEKGEGSGKGGESTKSLLPRLCQRAAVYVADTGGKGSANIYITKFEPVDKVLAVGVNTEFSVEIKTANTKEGDTVPARLSLFVNEEKKHLQKIDVPSAGMVVKVPYKVLKEGEQVIRVFLEGDESPLDNERIYLAEVPPAMKVLVLDDLAERPAPDRASVFWEYAVAPPSAPGREPVTSFVVKTVTWDAAQKENFSDYGIVVIANMGDLPQGLVSRIMFYVREGGCLITFGGENVQPYPYEALYRQGEGPLPVVFKDKEEATGFLKPLIPDSGNLETGLFKFIRKTSGGEGKAQAAIKVLGQMSSGQPLVMLKPFGQGRSVVLAMDPSLKWSRLPLTVDYPVFVQELLRAVLGDPNRLVNLSVGDIFTQPVLLSSQHLLVKKPDSEKVRIMPELTPGEEFPRINFSDTDVRGLYLVDAAAGVLARRRFAVNLNPDESDMKKLTESEVESKYSKKVEFLPDGNLEKWAQRKTAIREFAGIFLFLVFLLMLTESFLAMRFGLRKG